MTNYENFINTLTPEKLAQILYNTYNCTYCPAKESCRAAENAECFDTILKYLTAAH